MPYTIDDTGNVMWEDDSPVSSPSQVDYRTAVATQTPADKPEPLPDPDPYKPDDPKTGYSIEDMVGYITGIPQSKPTVPTTRSGSVDVSSREATTRFDDNIFQPMEANRLKGVDRESALEYNKALKQWEPVAQAQAQATENQKAATSMIGDINAEKAKASSQFQLQIADLQKQQAIDDAADFAASQAKVQEKMDEYNQSLKEFSMMQLQPGRAYSNLTSFQRGGVMATAFIQDFLGAKGIKTSGMDYINRGIDLDIEAQKQAMLNKQTELSGKQNLYAMQREISQSDYEATVRTRGMMLEAMRAEVNGKLAAFDSPLAHAQAAAINAQFDQAQAKNMAEIAKEIQTQVTANMQIRTQQRGQNVQAAIARADRESRERIAALEANVALAGKAAPELKNVVHDMSGTALGQADNPTVYDDIQKKIQGGEEAVVHLNELVKLAKEASKSPGFAWNMFLDKPDAKFLSAYHKFLSAYTKSISGAAFSDEETKRYEKTIPMNKLLTAILSNNDGKDVVGSVYNQLSLQSLGDIKREARIWLKPLTPEQAKQYQGGYNPDGFKQADDIQAETTALTAPEKPLTRVQKLIGGADSYGGKETDPVRLKADDADIVDFRNAGLKDSKASLGKASSGAPWQAGATVPRWASAMHDVYEVIIDPLAPESDRNEAVATLSDMISRPNFHFPGFRTDEKANNAVRAYAEYLLINSDKTAGGRIPTGATDDASPESTPYYTTEIVGR